MLPDALFTELKPHIEALADPLFGASEMFVRKRGGFLPHGAVLESSGEVRLVMAAPDDFGARRFCRGCTMRFGRRRAHTTF